MRTLLAGLAAVLFATIALAQGGHDVVTPYVPPPKTSSGLNDPVTRLVHRLTAGQARLEFDATRGFLPAVLRELRIPTSSQVLVFSKTSLQHEYISPQTPRAIYFSDDAYVGFVPDGGRLEISAVDPGLGAVFYTLSQSRAGAGRPSLVTDAECYQCHATAVTQGIPGHLLRSVFVRSDGQMASGARSFLTDDSSPLEERWGGWFVSGSLTGATHMGNAILRTGEDESTFDRTIGSGIANPSRLFQSGRYLASTSDIVALMVLDHQVRMHNMIAKLHRDAKSGAPLTETIEALVRYMLFVDEAALKGPVTGSTSFAADFERRGPKDSQGRSLRQFNLRTRTFRYPCSYLIYSDAFLGLPAEVKQQIYGRLSNVLTGRDTSPTFSKLLSADRTAITEILAATDPEFAAATR